MKLGPTGSFGRASSRPSSNSREVEDEDEFEDDLVAGTPRLLRVKDVKGCPRCGGTGFDANFSEQVIGVFFDGVNG